MILTGKFQILEHRSFLVDQSSGIIRWRTQQQQPNCPVPPYSTPPSSIRHYIRRSPYVPIFDYLQTKLWTLSCNKQAPQSITTLVLLSTLKYKSGQLFVFFVCFFLYIMCNYYCFCVCCKCTEEKRSLYFLIK